MHPAPQTDEQTSGPCRHQADIRSMRLEHHACNRNRGQLVIEPGWSVCYHPSNAALRWKAGQVLGVQLALP